MVAPPVASWLGTGQRGLAITLAGCGGLEEDEPNAATGKGDWLDRHSASTPTA